MVKQLGINSDSERNVQMEKELKRKVAEISNQESESAFLSNQRSSLRDRLSRARRNNS